jgi:hypothetical protein
MSSTTNENFWQVMRTFTWPEPQPVSYRLYHDDQGHPLFYTMEALPGTYIEVDQVTYVNAPYNVMVKNGRLTMLTTSFQVWRLVPDAIDGTACDPKDICVVVSTDQPHQKWSKKTNDIC